MKAFTSALTVGLVVGVFAACGSSGSSGGGGGCPDVSGSWTLSGSCADNSCTVTQNGCNVTLSCSPSGEVYQGSVSGSTISFGAGSTSCSANFGNKAANGSCNDTTSGACQFTGSCVSGACGVSSGSGGGTGLGGGTGSGGSSGVDCNSSCSAITNCCPQMTFSSCLEGCSQASASQACLNCLNNTSCGSMVPCLVANCNVPSELCGGGV
ncbi:MAG: hypothetical protein R3B13_28035 [Polyangiaceae bacterium]